MAIFDEPQTKFGDGNVFSRDECTFNYCPNPELCQEYCQYKFGKGRGWMGSRGQFDAGDE